MRSNSHAFLKVEVLGNGNVTGITFTGKRSEPLYTGENDSENISMLLLLLLLFLKKKYTLNTKRFFVDDELNNLSKQRLRCQKPHELIAIRCDYVV